MLLMLMLLTLIGCGENSNNVSTNSTTEKTIILPITLNEMYEVRIKNFFDNTYPTKTVLKDTSLVFNNQRYNGNFIAFKDTRHGAYLCFIGEFNSQYHILTQYHTKYSQSVSIETSAKDGLIKDTFRYTKDENGVWTIESTKYLITIDNEMIYFYSKNEFKTLSIKPTSNI